MEEEMSYVDAFMREYFKGVDPEVVERAKRFSDAFSTDGYTQEEKDALLGRDYRLPKDIEAKVDAMDIGDDAKRKAKRVAYRLYDNLRNTFFPSNRELYVHTARDEYAQEVGKDDAAFKPVVRYICDYTIGVPLEDVTKLLKY